MLIVTWDVATVELVSQNLKSQNQSFKVSHKKKLNDSYRILLEHSECWSWKTWRWVANCMIPTPFAASHERLGCSTFERTDPPNNSL